MIKRILTPEEKALLLTRLRQAPIETDRIYKRQANYLNEQIVFAGEGKRFVFPSFAAHTHFKNMELDKLYTLKELGLGHDNN